ncbi:uncharacterized protein N7459_008727 [Penicillium hispanicum]|uniref:uncharacterized protein n=1 Tax=Penicillium hispanicum TaxID=1080232 RepID=UPI002541B55D|nr:uncharacterized protein N7459_008727 [Penicillium hispanicum]KAJ5574300.1 hypothetical protein N7459_008727 [Penicillium hispanicum]
MSEIQPFPATCSSPTNDDSKDVTSPEEHPSGSLGSPTSSLVRFPFQKQYCFLYGTLKDPGILSTVLHSSEPPKMRPARVISFYVKLWGPYPTLLVGPPFQPIEAPAYEMQSQEECDRIVAYESDKLRLHPCLIAFLDDPDGVKEIVEGVTFVWNGPPQELKGWTVQGLRIEDRQRIIRDGR